MEVISVVFKRNPDVVIEVLNRVNDFCEHCNKVAPFLRAKDGSPYLEVHHTLPLSDGGKDIVENAVALCPNCHRKAHYGMNHQVSKGRVFVD
jgi:5-methylcytosine-specific restriction enzyme A